jgi:WhiB family redox-sensing transcriptional regulator
MSVIGIEIGIKPEPWQQRALCAETDPELFHPEKGGSTRDAKRVCNACEVRAECLDWALEKDEKFGVLGGMSERERRREAKRRREVADAAEDEVAA